MLLKNGTALLFEQGGFVPQDIRVKNGKILEMAQTLSPEAGEEVVDASGCFITPGLIDAHSHICISEEGGGSEGDDCCDYSGTATPELEVLDGLYPFDRAVKDCVRAGVTTTCVAPGSDGVVGGMASVIQLTGHVADEMLVRRMAAMKCSVGENPKKANYNFCSRMGVAFQLRKAFDAALDYKHRKEEAEKSGTYFCKDRGMEHMLLVSCFTLGLNFTASGLYPEATKMGVLELTNIPYPTYLRHVTRILVPMLLAGTAVLMISPYLGLV